MLAAADLIEQLARELTAAPAEINVSNYDHDDACRLNSLPVEVILGIEADALAKAELRS